MKATLRALFWGELGQDLIEYSLLGALLSIVSVIALRSLGGIILSENYMLMFQMKHFLR